MTSIRTVEGRLTDGGGRKFALVVTRWNSFIVDRLQQAAIDCLLRHGVSEDDVTVVRCPGAVEIPIVARRLADRGQFDAIIALGAVIRGGTPHFEYVAGECASGIGSINRAGTVPVAFGVLTVDTVEQAIERAGGKAGNKGEEAAATALEMVSLLDQLD